MALPAVDFIVFTPGLDMCPLFQSLFRKCNVNVRKQNRVFWNSNPVVKSEQLGIVIIKCKQVF